MQVNRYQKRQRLSAELHQVVLSTAPFSIWLQWNLCWAATNKANLVSNIISLEPNLISAPVCFSRQWLYLPLCPLLFFSFCSPSLPASIRPSLYVSVTCPSSWRRWVSALAWEPRLPWLEALFSLWICVWQSVSVCVRLCVCMHECVYVCAGGECQRAGYLLHQQAFQSWDPLSVWVDKLSGIMSCLLLLVLFFIFYDNLPLKDCGK